MGKFLDTERERQAVFKQSSPYFSAAAQADGLYHSALRRFCLPVENAAENLHEPIRASAIAYFQQHQIAWHRGTIPNHLCSSQVCAVNFLFPFADKPDALKHLLLPLYPNIRTMLPLEADHYVAFEWIGEQNYLGEGRGNRRTRGANTTSADGAVMFEREDGLRQILLIEWKYTEAYSASSVQFAGKAKTDRLPIYERFLLEADSPITLSNERLSDLFYEPFYQFMRQQLLAHEMEKAKELGADVVSVLHIAPKSNRDFEHVTSPQLSDLGKSATEVWKQLLRKPNRFLSVGTESLFGQFPIAHYPALTDSWAYLHQRYTWLNE